MFQVTQDLYVGRFASRERLNELVKLQVTDVVNVSDAPSQLAIHDGPFRSVSWFDISDRTLIPTKVAIQALDSIHSALSAEGGRVYVHCIAGWNRSPTIIWLYLIACGMNRDLAARTICTNAFDAIPGHQLLVDAKLVSAVVNHGHDNYLPHPRSESIQSPSIKQQ